MRMTPWPRIDLVELALISVLVALGFYSLGGRPASIPPTPERAWLAAQYGPKKYSEHDEEWIVRDFFKDKRGGTFVDIGAAHYRDFSNTYILERDFGWSGISVDAQARFGNDYGTYRPRTRFRSFFVSDVSDSEAVLFVNRNPWVASESRSFAERWDSQTSSMSVPTITLDRLLAAERVERFDFLSMDIELAEPRALAGFSIERYRPSFACIEAHPEVRQAILDYFAAHDYVLVGKYLRADDYNLYFMPTIPATGSSAAVTHAGTAR